MASPPFLASPFVCPFSESPFLASPFWCPFSALPFSLAVSFDFSHCSKFSSRALSTSTPISSCSFSVGLGPSTNDDSSSSSVSGTVLKVRKRIRMRFGNYLGNWDTKNS